MDALRPERRESILGKSQDGGIWTVRREVVFAFCRGCVSRPSGASRQAGQRGPFLFLDEEWHSTGQVQNSIFFSCYYFLVLSCILDKPRPAVLVCLAFAPSASSYPSGLSSTQKSQSKFSSKYHRKQMWGRLQFLSSRESLVPNHSGEAGIVQT